MAGGHSLGLKQGPAPRDPSHPERIRAGQVFFPLQGRRRRRLTVRRVEGEWVQGVLDDGSSRRLSLDRLLAVDEAGVGSRYRFQGWKARPRGYRTEMRVVRIDPRAGLCYLVLPEWDAATEIEELLSALPASLQAAGAAGSCMANLASPSVAGLEIHDCRPWGVRGRSRVAAGQHPAVLVEGQRYRRLEDGSHFRILESEPVADSVRVWNGRRAVRLGVDRLLARAEDGDGRYYTYLGGGLRETRRRQAA